MNAPEKAPVTQQQVYELVLDIFQALDGDLESGAHWLNNAASEKFDKDYPNTVKALHALAVAVEGWGPA